MTPDGAKEAGVGAWSKKGEFLGRVACLGGEVFGETSGSPAYLSVGRGSRDRGVTVTLHSFSGGYRVLVEEWGREEGEDRVLWLAPVTEEENYIGLFTEEEVRRMFPYLFAALEIPKAIEIG